MKSQQHMSQFIIALLIVTVFSSLGSAGNTWAASEKQITLVVGEAQGNVPKLLTLIGTEAFRRLGMELTVKVYPAKRGSTLSNSGEVDGELGRSSQHSSMYPNLLRVEESTISLIAAAYATNPAIHVDGWESLRDTAYRVDYIRGHMLSTAMLPPLVKPENLTAVNQTEQALKKLVAGRTDIFVNARDLVMPVLATDEFSNAGIREAGILQEVPLYMLLHKKHADLIPQLEQALKAMKEEGLIEQYTQQVME